MGAHKSGTSLLRSILDGHSRLYAIPVETHYFQNMQYWVDYEYRAQRPRKVSRADILDTFCQWIHWSNTAEDPYADTIASGQFDETLFREHFSGISEEANDKERMERYFEALHLSLTGKKLPSTLRVVEKSVENAEFARELFSIFPGAKFIHIVRNPYANMVSLRKYKSIAFGFPLMPRLIKSLYNSYYFLYKNRRTLFNYYVITYEELVGNPESSVKNICTFLELPFEDILLTPTSQRVTWKGNSMSGQKLDGIVATNVDRWRAEITPMEVAYCNKVFSFVLEDFGYQMCTTKKSFLRPAPGENIRRYLYNRCYHFYLKDFHAD